MLPRVQEENLIVSRKLGVIERKDVCSLSQLVDGQQKKDREKVLPIKSLSTVV